MTKLDQYARNVFSQYGEDGILEETFRRLGTARGYFVEFGAWDGKACSNCYHLYSSGGWKGCYIEGERDRFERLEQSIPDSSITKVNRFVQVSGEDSLDAILTRASVPREFDLLSVDIDSDDYAVWASLRGFSPMVVVIEYNATIPNACHYVQPPGHTKGNSARAIYELGREKGYELIAATRTNLLFVREERFAELGLGRTTLDEARPDIGHIFYGYDGAIITTGELEHNPWQYVGAFQPIPKAFRYWGARSLPRDSLKEVYIVLASALADGGLRREHLRRALDRFTFHRK